MQRIRYRLVYNRRNMLNKQGKALIQVEASLNGRKVYISTRTYIVPFEWDKRTSTVINHPNARDINTWLFEFMMKIEGFELSLWKRGVIPTLLQIKDSVKGKSVKDLSFRSFCLSVIDKSNRKKGTKCNLRSTLTMMDEFKTGYDLKIPLYLVFEGKALDILNRYPSIESLTNIGCNADTNRHLAVLQKMAKIDTRTTFHTARHTCATLLCHQGVPITTVQKILGHTKLTTTQLYSEVMADTIVKDLKSVNKKSKRNH